MRSTRQLASEALTLLHRISSFPSAAVHYPDILNTEIPMMRHITFTFTLGFMLCAMASAGCSSTKAPTSAANQWLKPPTVPPKLNVPAGNAVIYHARATGTQIYVAKPSPDGKLAWTLKAPSADLFDEDGSKVGTHFAGP